MMMPSIFEENLFDDWMDSLEEEFFGRKNLLYGKHAKNMMKTDMRETDGTYEVGVDLLGLKKENISVSFKSGYSTVSINKTFD